MIRSTIKAAMTEQRIKAAELSRRSGVSHPAISSFLSGKRGITIPALESLFAELGIKCVAQHRKKTS